MQRVRIPKLDDVAGYLPGTKVFASEGAVLDSGKRSGGVAILVPPGWKVERAHELVPAKGLALLIRDRATQFYLVSVYLHPESKKRDLEKLMQEWARLEKDTARVVFVGDFNRIDETHSALWNSFLGATSCVDVDPKLITYYTQEVSSPLDRCLLYQLSGSRLPVGTQLYVHSTLFRAQVTKSFRCEQP